MGCMRGQRPVAPEEVPPTVRTTLRYLVEGYERAEIAVERGLSLSAVSQHITALLTVYDARNMQHLVALAVRAGHV